MPALPLCAGNAATICGRSQIATARCALSSRQPQAAVGPRSAPVPPSLRADRRSEAVQLRATGQRASPPCSSAQVRAFRSPLAGPLSLVRAHACAAIPVSRCLDAPSVGASRFCQPLRRVIDSARASVSAFTVRIGQPDERALLRVLRFRRARARGQPINGVERLAARPDRRCLRVSALQPARVACPLSRALVRTLAFCLRARVARSRGRPKYAKRGHRRTAPRRAGSLTCKTRNDPDKRMSAAPPSHGSARRVRTVWRGELGATPDTRFYLAATHSLAFRDNDGLTNCESVPADDARKAWVRRALALRDWLRVRPATTRRVGRASTARAYAARRYRTHQSGSGARGRADVAGKEEERHEPECLQRPRLDARVRRDRPRPLRETVLRCDVTRRRRTRRQQRRPEAVYTGAQDQDSGGKRMG
ncbi:hypothetical protein ERJ75_001785100 [Trypanosoma vivax]|nr:hypothetical protein ERJ75_001785100 [Trypanosoma vivax]